MNRPSDADMAHMSEILMKHIQQDLAEQMDWWNAQQEILLIHGRQDPRLEQRFLDEWDQTPPPLASIHWREPE